ncbi:MAG: peptidoglycan DD-metalloendopeptidase family protein [Proteobacteria bacterium]|nr:peptidoglycan DD-metalloendopeptidase family protein [Pseudomonadota bacterium]
MSGLRALAIACLLLAGVAWPASAQDSREAARKLDTVKRELQAVAAERRKIESQRGGATRQLREVDEKVGATSRRLRETEARLARERAALDQLQQQRGELQAGLATQRTQLARLLRAAYMQGRAAPLKVLLAQDRLADANRLLTYHRYLQQDRAQRITALAAELERMKLLEREIAARRVELDATAERQRAQLAELQADRKRRTALVARLDQRYQDRSAREKALGRDAKGLEQLLGRLRAAAARAEAQRKAAAARGSAGAGAGTRAGPAAPQVGGLGWPLSGALIAGYGAKLPDGRGSDGLLIGASAGTPVQAVADGQVAYAEWMTGYGLLLIIDHGNGYMSLYAHNEALLKDAGDAVERGDTVATVGSSGGHGRPALYFELRRDGKTVDPGGWLKR